MKKLLTLLLLVPMMFSACGDDDGVYNPVEGEWEYEYSDGSVETIYFTSNFNTGGFTSNKYGTIIKSWNDGEYEINKDRIFYVNHPTKVYKIYNVHNNNKNLLLTNPSGTESKNYRKSISK